eukprot:CAMPEP_0117597004 /NCGR_PEP_ID=MMETSP0784-20121206/74622_1 /TAXON_ID=39447 /ORGANISM="" /LENGTH=307 /DNA_ID=CAMNT_0005399339 /DNA_START=50 /DNA_END=975 /DNA_ORIENTATION=+
MAPLQGRQALAVAGLLLCVRVASEGGEGLHMIDKTRRYMITWHPHGFLAWSSLFIVSKMAVFGHPVGREWFGMVAPALFQLPFFSEALMLVNGRRVDKTVVENLLNKGKTIAIQPGGVREQLLTRHDQEQAVFPANLGFIRMALRFGTPLLTAYVFNENQVMKRVEGLDAASDFVFRHTGFGVPAVTTKLGLPLPLLPLSTDIHVRWAAPLEVGPADPDPSEERVEELFVQYIATLRRVFRTHAHECLPPEVAARGLKIIRLDGKPVPPRAALSVEDAVQGDLQGEPRAVYFVDNTPTLAPRPTAKL